MLNWSINCADWGSVLVSLGIFKFQGLSSLNGRQTCCACTRVLLEDSKQQQKRNVDNRFIIFVIILLLHWPLFCMNINFIRPAVLQFNNFVSNFRRQRFDVNWWRKEVLKIIRTACRPDRGTNLRKAKGKSHTKLSPAFNSWSFEDRCNFNGALL